MYILYKEWKDVTRRRLRFALAVTLLFFCVHLVLDADALAQGTAPPALGTVSLVAGADTLALDAGTLTLRAASPALGAAPPAPGAALLVASTSPPALGAAPLSAGTDTLSEPGFPDGWWAPTIGPGKGHWDLRVGVHAWTDHIELRNLRLRGLIDLGPGLRALAVVRSNSDVAGITTVAPRIDELYLEKYGYYTRGAHRLSLSLRLGVLRYLRFPYPDIISTFDQVPGIADLQGTHPTGYGGLVATAEYEHASGLGAHFTAIKWGFGYPGRHDLIEGYGFYRTQLGPLDLELRAGILALRPEPLGKGAPGYNVYLGYRDPEWQAGVLYEKLQGQPVRTGVMVRFAFPHSGQSQPITGNPWRPDGHFHGSYLSVSIPAARFAEAAGRVALDYTRAPQGIAFEIPLAKGSFGMHGELPPPQGAQLVGEIHAERVTTYWQNGQSRNYYEHVTGQWGETGDPALDVVVVEGPWYLQLEALVSPNMLTPSQLREWERQRQGPAQLAQPVVYQFYRSVREPVAD